VTVIAFAAPLFIIALVWEWRRSRRRTDLQGYEGRDTAANLAMGVGNRILEVGWIVVELAVLAWLHDRAAFDLGHGVAAWLVALLAVDLAYYWYHRMHHEVRLLWASHVAHHSSQRYNLAVALRQPWIVFTTLPFLAPVALLGVDGELIALSWALNLLYQFWIHTELIDRMPRWFEATFNTPSHHRVHHGKNPEYLDKNYAGVLIVWDRWFGTFEPEVAPVRYGLTKDIATHNPFRIATHELVAIARDVRAASSWSERYGRVFRGPGWQPTTRTLEVATA
jgi:sterol desaturase/sphingolipid hydroxylase (fatty acid hydroxylase superfamily)